MAVELIDGSQVMNLHNALSLIRLIPDYPKTGILFRDITPLLANADALAIVTKSLLGENIRASHISGIEARGFILASAMSIEAKAGFVPIRKAGKLPYRVFSESYSLEYGEAQLEVHQDAFIGSTEVLLVDDVLATGGTILAALSLIEKAGGNVTGVKVLLEIEELGARARIAELYPQLSVHSLVKV